MSAPVRTDTLSLTLPKALGRARAKRRPKPPGLFWFYLAMTGVWIGLAVWAVLSARAGLIVVDSIGAALNWRVALHIRAGGSPAAYAPHLLALFGASLVAGFLP